MSEWLILLLTTCLNVSLHLASFAAQAKAIPGHAMKGTQILGQ